MSTAFAATQAALLAALSATPPLAGGRISANRIRPIAEHQNTAIALYMNESTGSEHGGAAIYWNTNYTIECYARTTPGTDCAIAVDSLLASVWQRLSALDTSTMGADLILQPQIDWQYDTAETPVVCATLHLTARHYTLTATLSARS